MSSSSGPSPRGAKKRNLAEAETTNTTSDQIETEEKSEEKDSNNEPSIDPNAKGWESFDNYIEQLSKSERCANRAYLQLTTIAQLISNVNPDLDTEEADDPEQAAEDFIKTLPLQTIIENVDYLWITEKTRAVFNEIGKSFDTIGRDSDDEDNDGGFCFSMENTNTGNLKAFHIQNMIKKLKTFWRKHDFENAFAYALAITYISLDGDNSDVYWLNDNECNDEIDDDIMAPLAGFWSKLLKKNCTEFGCIDDTNDRKCLVSYLKRIETSLTETDGLEYERFILKLPKVNTNVDSAAAAAGASFEPPKKKQRRKK